MQNESKAIELFRKDYNGESLYDLSRDIMECFDPSFNDIVKQIPQGDDVLCEEFEVVVIWKKNKDNNHE